MQNKSDWSKHKKTPNITVTPNITFLVYPRNIYLLFVFSHKTQSKLRQSAALHESAQQEQFNEVAYEKERLENDAEAMDAMKIVAKNEFAKLRTLWKREINLGHDGRAQHCLISKTSTSSHS